MDTTAPLDLDTIAISALEDATREAIATAQLNKVAQAKAKELRTVIKAHADEFSNPDREDFAFILVTIRFERLAMEAWEAYDKAYDICEGRGLQDRIAPRIIGIGRFF